MSTVPGEDLGLPHLLPIVQELAPIWLRRRGYLGSFLAMSGCFPDRGTVPIAANRRESFGGRVGIQIKLALCLFFGRLLEARAQMPFPLLESEVYPPSKNETNWTD